MNSSVTALKLLLVAARFSSSFWFLSSTGLMPFASKAFASSFRFLASANDTDGYSPKLIVPSLPFKVYLKRHIFYLMVALQYKGVQHRECDTFSQWALRS